MAKNKGKRALRLKAAKAKRRKTQHEVELETEIFGEIEIPISSFKAAQEAKVGGNGNSAVFVEDLKGDLKEKAEAGEDFESESSDSEVELKPAWEDSDDDGVNGSDYLPKWAKINSKKEEKSTSILRSTTNLIGEPKEEDVTDFIVTKTDFLTGHFERSVTAVEFSKDADLLMAASFDKKISLFKMIEGKISHLATFTFPKCRIRSAKLSQNAKGVFFCGGRHAHFFHFDFERRKVATLRPIFGHDGAYGKAGGEKANAVGRIATSGDKEKVAAECGNGAVKVFCGVALREVCGVAVNGKCEDMAFGGKGALLYTADGDNSEVYIWDIANKKCHDRIKNNSVKIKAVAVSRNDEYMAIGDDSGVVTVFRNNEVLKTFDNLVTKIDFLSFNSDAKLLLAFSADRKNSIRLVPAPFLSFSDKQRSICRLCPFSKIGRPAFSTWAE